jgi:outer membrane receptor protein involved in Fe transport
VTYRFRAFGAKLATAQMNIQNVFDKVYFDHGGSGGTRLNTYYGEPRMFMLSLRADF